MKVYCVFSLESPHRGDSNEYTRYTIFNMKKKNTLNYPKICSYGFFSKVLKNEFETGVVNEPSVFEPLKFYCIFSDFLQIYLNLDILMLVSFPQFNYQILRCTASLYQIDRKKEMGNANPADKWCKNDVVLTSMRGNYVALTSIRRHFGTKCPLGTFWAQDYNHS